MLRLILVILLFLASNALAQEKDWWIISDPWEHSEGWSDYQMQIRVNGVDQPWIAVDFNCSEKQLGCNGGEVSYWYQIGSDADRTLIESFAGRGTAYNAAEDTTWSGEWAIVPGRPDLTLVLNTQPPTPVIMFPMGDFTGIYNLNKAKDNVSILFNLTPAKDGIDGIVSYADSTVDPPKTHQGSEYYDAFYALLQLATDNTFRVSDDDIYRADMVIGYTADEKETIRISFNFKDGIYTVWIGDMKLAEDYAFRSSAPAANDLGKVGLMSYPAADKEFKIENHTSKY